MKKFIVFIMLAMFLLPALGRADNSQNTSIQKTTVVLKKTSTSQTTARPRTPNLQEVVCEWEDDVLSISFDIPEGYASVIVTNSSGMPVLIDTFDTSLIYSAVVGDLSTLCGIEVVTDDGNSYIGWF